MRGIRTVAALFCFASFASFVSFVDADDVDALKKARALETDVCGVVEKVVPAFVFIGGGSGVCISDDGWFLTNYHVVNVQDRSGNNVMHWRVKTQDGQTFVADVVGTDRRGDLALLRMKDAKGRPHVDLGDSDAEEIGDMVIAVGDPFLLGRPDCRPTVSLGIVSANHRCQGVVRTRQGIVQPRAMEGYYDCFQTDAAVNPGNSGGPLFSMKGELLGINGSISPRFGNRVNTGIGYAIPSNQIRRFLPRLKEGKGNSHGMVDGLVLSPKESDLDGALVGRVRDGSDAAKAGFQKDDVIVQVQGMPCPTPARFLGICWTWPAGEELTFKVKRGGETVEVKAKSTGIDPGEKARQTITMGWKLTGADGGGARIDTVRDNSAASKAGLKEGDVVKSIDDTVMKDSGELLKAIGGHKPGDKVTLHIERDGKKMDVDVTLEAGK